MYNNVFDSIHWIYGADESAAPKEDLKNVRPRVKFHSKLPQCLSDFGTNALIICDDVTQTDANSDAIYRAGLIGTHHSRQSLVLILHNVFTKGGNFKSVALNTHYSIFFRLPRLYQVEIFFRQIDPANWKKLRDVYTEQVLQKPYGYLVVDDHPQRPYLAIRYRTRIFPGDEAAEIFCTSDNFENFVTSLKDGEQQEKK